jgi:DNA-binding IclR family transcriptional regulator
MAGNTRQSGRSVTSKVVAIMDAFLTSRRELTLNDLAERTGLPLSTTYRLVTELVDWGGLERVETGGYRIGLRLWEIGHRASGGINLQQAVAPYMQDLYEATHENVQLAVLSGREALYIEKITGRRSTPIRTRRGGRLPLHATGVGKVLLAHAPEEFLDDLLRARPLKRYTPHTIVAPAHLRRALADIRRTGLGYAKEELTLGSMSVAAPVFDAAGNAVAAMSLVLRSSRADLRRLGPAVRTASLSASRELTTRSIRMPGGAHGLAAPAGDGAATARGTGGAV